MWSTVPKGIKNLSITSLIKTTKYFFQKPSKINNKQNKLLTKYHC